MEPEAPKKAFRTLERTPGEIRDAVTESECVWLDDSQVDAIRVYREQGHRDEVRMEEGTMQIVIEDLSKADEMPF